MHVTFVSFDTHDYQTILENVIRMNAEISRPVLKIAFKDMFVKMTDNGPSYQFNADHGSSIVAEGDKGESFKSLALRVIDLSHEMGSDAHLFYKDTRIGVTKEQSSRAKCTIGGRTDLMNDMLTDYYNSNPTELADVLPGERILLEQRRSTGCYTKAVRTCVQG